MATGNPTDYVTPALETQERINEKFVRTGRFDVWMENPDADTTVVFVPTFAELNFVYAPLISALSPNYRTIAYRPAVSAHQRFGPEERAAELRELLDELGIAAPVHMVSWSDAGTGLVEFCRATPQLVRSCVYLGMPWKYSLPGGLRQLATLYSRSRLHALTPDILAAGIIATLMGGAKLPSRALLGQIRAIGPVARYLRYSVLPCIHYVTPQLNPTCPTLVMGGDADRFVDRADMELLATKLGATFVFVPDGDHFLAWTSQHEVTSAVTEFIDRIDLKDGESVDVH